MALYNKKMKHLSESDTGFEKIVITALFFMTLFITLFPFFKMGFTCTDDFQFYNTALRGDFARNAQCYAQSQGRFYFLITKPLYSLPYLFDNFIFYKCFQLFCLLLSYVSFSYLIKKLTHSNAFAIATGLFLMIATPITINLHLPFIAYPCYFTFSFALFCFGCVLLVKYYETNSYKFLIFSAIVLFCATLFYEVYLLFLFFIVCFMVCRYWHKNGVGKSLASKRFYVELLPVACSGLLYVGLYLFYRRYANSTYAGNVISSDFSWTNFFTILYECTKGVFPLQNFNQMAATMAQNSPLYEGHYKSFVFALMHAPVQAYANALLQMLLLYWLVRKMENSVTWKQLIAFVLCGSALAFSSHILIAVTPKYNNDWYSYMQGYVTSFYSFFFIILALVSLGYALLKISYKSKPLFGVCVVVLAAVAGMVSVVNQYTNDHASRAWQLSHQRFVVLDEMFKTNAFQALKPSDVVYAPDFCDEYMGTIFVSRDWRNYIKDRYNPEFRFCFLYDELARLKSEIEEQQADIYYLHHLDNIAANEHLWALAPIVRESFDFSSENNLCEALCDSATVYYYSPAKNFALLFDVPQAEDSTTAVFDRQDTVTVRNGLNLYPVNYIYWNYSFSPLSICDIKCKGMRVNGFGVTNVLRREESHEINPYWRSMQ